MWFVKNEDTRQGLGALAGQAQSLEALSVVWVEWKQFSLRVLASLGAAISLLSSALLVSS